MQLVVQVQEKLSVFVFCNFKYPKKGWYTTYGYWFRLYQQYHMTKK